MTVSFDVPTLLPMLLPLGGMLLMLLVDLLAPRATHIHIGIAVLSLLAGLIAALPIQRWHADTPRLTQCLGDTTVCLWESSPMVSALQVTALFAAIVVVLLSTPALRLETEGRGATRLALLLTAAAGSVGVAAARDAGSWLVSLEMATVPVVVLVALPATRGAIAGAIQLLTTSLTSFAMLVLGVAAWFGATGSIIFDPRAAVFATRQERPALLALAVVLILAGLAFKLSLVPFHAWTPTAYAGAPVPIAAFLAATSKVAALGALLVIFQSLANLGKTAFVAVAVLALGSMTVGNIIALRQQGAVRLLAWSTVAQAGWVVLPLVSTSSLMNPTSPGMRGAATYLIAYVSATLVAFCVVAAVWGLGVSRAGEPAGGRLTAYTGLLRRQPLAGIALILALTSLAGLPPGIIGLVGKVVALQPVVNEGLWFVGLWAAVNAVLGAAVYLRWLRLVIGMDTDASLADSAPSDSAALALGGGHALMMPAVQSKAVSWALGLSVTVLVAISVLPQLVLGSIR